DAQDVLRALECDDAQLQRIARAARERTLEEHTCHHRARLLLRLLEETGAPADAGHVPARGSFAHDARRRVGEDWRA
ncbi:MAG TPA: glycosyltransferase, partial [Steroidobacter sp.]|nr:glycosyltransferase [Steroidobacter sp.]